MRPFGLITLTLAGGGSGVSALVAQTEIIMATTTSARITPATIRFKNYVLKHAII
jgi:hypothetical protein